jgi:hypothetical protein|tara:strand:- start:829 stop:1431 length:603 start_codon:yes stop_codon:yes gene_type:complete
MPIQINGNGTITGISSGGLPAGSVTSATLASGAVAAAMPSGSILQVKSDTLTSTLSNNLASQTWWSVYNAGLQVTLTPSSASNKILLMAQVCYSEGTGQYYQFRFERDGADIAGTVGDAAGSRFRVTGQFDNIADNAGARTHHIVAQVDAADTNSRIYNVAIRHSSGLQRQMYINRTYADTDHHGHGRGISTITAMEIKA